MEPTASADRALAIGRLCIVGAAILWSLNGLFAKAPIFDAWPREERGTMLAFWRALFAGLWLLPAVRRPQWSWRLLPMIAAFAAMNVSFLQSMSLTTAANAGWLQAMAPLWVFVFTLCLGREPINRRDLVPLAWGVGGVTTILVCELWRSGTGEGSLPGVLFGVASGVFYALVIISMRGLRDQNGAWSIALNHLVAAAVIAPYCLGRYPIPSGNQLLVLCAFGLLQMSLPYLLMAQALRSIGSQEAVAIGLLEPVLVPVWVYLAWGEVPDRSTIAGATMILIGLGLRYRRREN
jgi:drug/metabolite transporter (DMT)-like permease